jgi:hypothetical protein
MGQLPDDRIPWSKLVGDAQFREQLEAILS